MESAESSVAAAERHLRQGEPLAAYNAAQAGLEGDPRHVRLRQLQALALARSGDVERANALLSGLAAEGLDDGETLGMLARTHKDLALRAADGGERARHLEDAFETYERAFRGALQRDDADAAAYTGINAAAMAAMRGDTARARATAREVRALAGEGYWHEAVLGEAALILGEPEVARAHYARAAALAGRRFGDLASTRRQARLLEPCLGLQGPAPSEVLSIPPVVAYSGHMIDRPGRATPRFPPALEDRVREQVRSRLSALAPAAVYGSAACGADLLCLEAARELGCETHVILPFPAPAFREHSVAFAGAGWGERLERALANADSVFIASDHPTRGSAATYEYANLLLTGMARLRSRVLDAELRALAVHDPRDAGAAGGTASVAELWNRWGVPVESVLIDTGAQDPATPAAPAAPPQPAPIRHEMRSLLFADAVGYSKLTEDQIPLYITEFLGSVAELGRRIAQRYEHVEVSGDGLYMVFHDPLDAGRYALALSALAGGTDWAARGLPAGLNLRIALHSGPVHCGRDPLTGGPIFTGPHASRAARIEPITPPGQVYASNAFAAVVAASGGEGLALSYVGRLPLAKGYGALGLYHVRPDA